jgi:hypothetical protein
VIDPLQIVTRKMTSKSQSGSSREKRQRSLMCSSKNRREYMITRKLLVASAALSFALVALPALAASGTVQNGHHYLGGPKTEGHHMGSRSTEDTSVKAKSTGGHHYSGGPRGEPHHMGDKN